MMYAVQLNQQSDLDKIILHLQGKLKGKYELSSALEQKLKDMSDCRDLIRLYASRIKVVAMLVEQGKSKTTAERLYSDTLTVFNTTQTSHRDFWIDVVMGQIFETRRKALAEGNLKVVAACEANVIRTIELMTDAKDAELYDRLIVPRIVVKFDPSLTGVTLPDDWENQVQQIIKKAKSRDVSQFTPVEFQENGNTE